MAILVKIWPKLKILTLAVESKKMGPKAQKIIFWPFGPFFSAKIGLFWPKIGQKSCYLYRGLGWVGWGGCGMVGVLGVVWGGLGWFGGIVVVVEVQLVARKGS